MAGKSGKKIKQSNRDRVEDSKEGRVKSEIALNSRLRWQKRVDAVDMECSIARCKQERGREGDLANNEKKQQSCVQTKQMRDCTKN